LKIPEFSFRALVLYIFGIDVFGHALSSYQRSR